MGKYNELTRGQTEEIVNKLGGMEGVQRFLSSQFIPFDPAAKQRKAVVDNLFTFVGTFKTVGTKEFFAAKSFIINTSEEQMRVRISYLGGNFKTRLLSKIERDITASDLILSKLSRSSIDLPKNAEEPGTIASLGGLEKIEISLYEFFETLAYKQSIGDHSWLVGYTRDDEEILWTVSAPWGSGGWRVDACSVSGPRRWGAGDEFVSH